MSVNKVILIGNLGKDPVMRSLGNDRNVTNFSLATNEKRKDKSGETITKTEWHNITLYSPLAEIAQKYLKKGSQVYLEGKIESREYVDKENVTRRAYEIVCREMTLMGSAQGSSGSSAESNGNDAPAYAGKDEPAMADISSSNPLDDLPF
ncbi:MAG: single-stranded DNA-binding protein [Cytophagales bacterium]|nr:single-stranded DNA-binding protein [Cytophagales bacterium]